MFWMKSSAHTVREFSTMTIQSVTLTTGQGLSAWWGSQRSTAKKKIYAETIYWLLTYCLFSLQLVTVVLTNATQIGRHFFRNVLRLTLWPPNRNNTEAYLFVQVSRLLFRTIWGVDAFKSSEKLSILTYCTCLFLKYGDNIKHIEYPSFIFNQHAAVSRITLITVLCLFCGDNINLTILNFPFCEDVVHSDPCLYDNRFLFCAMSHRLDGQRLDIGDVLDGNCSHHRTKIQGLHGQIVGLHWCKVAVCDIHNIL